MLGVDGTAAGRFVCMKILTGFFGICFFSCACFFLWNSATFSGSGPDFLGAGVAVAVGLESVGLPLEVAVRHASRGKYLVVVAY